jgi:hypothetical protein
MVNERAGIEAAYGARRDAFALAEGRIGSCDRWLTHARTVAFLVAVALLSVGWMGGHLRPWYVAGGIVLAGFFALVTYHEHCCASWSVTDCCARSTPRRSRDSTATGRTWPRRDRLPSQHQSVSHDLDLFGHASLFHLLCTANTPTGRQVYCAIGCWNLPRRTRSAAGSGLSPIWRRTGSCVRVGSGRTVACRPGKIDRTVHRLGCGPAVAAAAALAAVDLPPVAGGLLGTILLTTTWRDRGASGWYRGAGLVGAERSGQRLVPGQRPRYLRSAQHAQRQDPRLLDDVPADVLDARIDRRIGCGQTPGDRAGGRRLLRLGELSWIVGLASISHSALFFLLVYLPLQLLLLYDFHLLYLVELWQKKYGRYAGDWFLALGKFEALASLAQLAHDHPDWSFPDVREDAAQLAARGLGHPLLPDAARVGNDVSVGPVGTFLLVTGSNMSGKSTLLRSIGVNAVLAEAGAPVCAAELSMPPVVLATSMRIHDSLEFGVSFYMAELMRLKQVVDLAARTQQQGGRRMLYLLDEILQGTNSKERHIAVERVLEHLLRHDAIGAVSTHDLELATSPLLRDACQCVHFRETLHGADAEQPMTFDYRLRPGVATTTNALKLLELVGLGE